MRIRDWSSDVCSSDLADAAVIEQALRHQIAKIAVEQPNDRDQADHPSPLPQRGIEAQQQKGPGDHEIHVVGQQGSLRRQQVVLADDVPDDAGSNGSEGEMTPARGQAYRIPRSEERQGGTEGGSTGSSGGAE